MADTRLDVVLPSGGCLRSLRSLDGIAGGPVILGLGGSGVRPGASGWSASITWLLRRLARDLPTLGNAELRYRDRSWRAFSECVRDAREALTHLPARRPIVLIGFSMGGGIAVTIAGDPRVRGVIGLAPWVPDQIPLDPLREKWLAVIHGSRDRALPFIPGVPPAHSERVTRRASAAGARTSHVLIEGAIHAIAVNTPFGPLPLPHAPQWSAAVAAQLTEHLSSTSAAPSRQRAFHER